MRKVWKVILSVCLFVYPIFVFLTLVVFKKDFSIVSIGMLIIGVAAFSFNSKSSNRITPAIMCVAALAFIITKSEIIIKFYPFWLTVIFIWMFLSPLLRKDCIILKFACLWDPAVSHHPQFQKIKKYCVIWNWIWIGFFFIQLIINFYLAIWGNTDLWAIYNGLISYLMQGVMFTLQFLINLIFNRTIDNQSGYDRKKIRAEIKCVK